MIVFDEVRTGRANPYTFEVERGGVTAIVSGDSFEAHELVCLLAGVIRPASGRILVDGDDIASMGEGGLLERSARNGIVWADGGIISNLKVWENIILPFLYHGGSGTEGAETLVRDVFERVGPRDLEAFMSMSPGALPDHDKVMIGILRAMLMDPDMMIYESVFQAFRPAVQKSLGGLLMDFHALVPGRTSIFVAASQGQLSHITANRTIQLGRTM